MCLINKRAHFVSKYYRRGINMFDLVSKFQPTGDQPQAIKSITDGILDGLRYQTLLGVTGSGKTFTMANIIKNIDRPVLVLAHNKTLAGQLCNEFREFFPNNRVEYFVSYYDYYQPEAYVVSSDTYIAKDMSVNEEIDKLRHSATCSLFERRDVIVVASVSCIYGLGSPEVYSSSCLSLREGQTIDKDEIIRKLIKLQYQRNDIDFKRLLDFFDRLDYIGKFTDARRLDYNSVRREFIDYLFKCNAEITDKTAAYAA